MDTGCPFDVTSRSALLAPDLDLIERARVPMTVQTVNGVVDCNDIVPQQIGPIQAVVDAYVTESSPCLLSVGRRVVDEGYAFYWDAWSETPRLLTPDGDVVDLVVQNYVPYLIDVDIMGSYKEEEVDITSFVENDTQLKRRGVNIVESEDWEDEEPCT